MASGDDTIITGGGDNFNSRDTYYGNGPGDDTIVVLVEIITMLEMEEMIT